MAFHFNFSLYHSVLKIKFLLGLKSGTGITCSLKQQCILFCISSSSISNNVHNCGFLCWGL